MSSSEGDPLETFMARLYVDASARQRFLADRDGEARRAGLGEDARVSLLAVRSVDLELAARSYERKRDGKGTRPPRPPALRERVRHFLARISASVRGSRP
jgi:hypothetical protein